jgi:O-antigen/teichoic acid export membrane protein
MLRRIILGVGANVFTQVVSIFIQLVSLPVFLQYWDTSTYGSWLLLSAMPAYLSMSDLGMVGAAGNKMTMAMGRSDLAEANNVYQSAQLFMTIVCFSLAAIMTPSVLFIPMPGFMTMDKRIALAALSCGVLLGVFSGLPDAVYRATGRYALGTMLGNLIRIGGWAGSIIGLILFRSFAGVALAGLLAAAVGTAVRVYLSQQGGHGLLLGFRHASKSELLSMIKPAVSFINITLANALNFQGMTLLVGATSSTLSELSMSSFNTGCPSNPLAFLILSTEFGKFRRRQA